MPHREGHHGNNPRNVPCRVVSRFGYLQWPARSPDLTPLDFFLWGYLKEKVYKSSPQSLAELKANITREINLISQDLLKRVMEEVKMRMQLCVESNGEYLKDVIFKK